MEQCPSKIHTTLFNLYEIITSFVANELLHA